MQQGSADAVAAHKRALRTAVRAARRVRAALPAADPARRAEADAIARAVADGAAAQLTHAASEGTPVCSYASLPGEPPTDALHEALAARGICVLLPLLLPDGELDWEVRFPDGTRSTPLGRDAIGRAGLVIVPAIAVDREGRRLGQGGGSYDRALARRRPDALTAALIDGDVADEVPTLPHDQTVDAVASAGWGWRLLSTAAGGGAP
ncbi:MAG: 5-formyltetrahydrofolate cyclo-ligase [Dermatophilaceae bacterium]